MKKLRILIADDHGLVRRGARVVLQSCQGWRVVGEAANGIEAVKKTMRRRPDVAIVDISMPELDGVAALRQVREALPHIKILVLTMHESGQIVRRALDAGADGYVLKSDLTESLVKAVKGVCGGKRFLTPKTAEIVLQGFLNAGAEQQQRERSGVCATAREVEIIRFLAQGKSNKAIAAQLGIAVRTVETHRAKLTRKLGLGSVAELIHYAMREGIISVPNVRNHPVLPQ